MDAAVIAVFDVLRVLQSWNWSVEAYTAAWNDYNMLIITIQNKPAASS
jgi:hypothetical protein